MTVLHITLIKPSHLLEEHMLEMGIVESDAVLLRFTRSSLKDVFAEELIRGDLFLCDLDLITESNLKHLVESTTQLIAYTFEKHATRSKALISAGVLDILTLPEEISVLESHLKRLMKQKDERTLLEKNYLSGLGTLAAGIAHEINNPIGYMQNNIAILSKYMTQLVSWIDSNQLNETERRYYDFMREDQEDIFSESREGIHQISHIVNSLRAYSKVDYASIRYEILISEEVDHVLNLLAGELYEGIQIEKVYETQGKVIMSSGNIGIAIMNVLQNAFDALVTSLKPNKHLQISLREYNEEIQLIIEDNGIGIDEVTRRHIFEPFYTTKPVGSATGLGLSTVYRIIVEEHGGHIQCESQIDLYTRFLIRLPRH